MRHAAHALLPHTLAGRMPGVALSPEGVAQASALAAAFAGVPVAGVPVAGVPVAAVFSSPVQRAIETAAPIAAALGLVVEVEAGFQEVDFGHWTSARFDALADDPDWHAWNRLRSVARCPGGETMAEAQARGLSALSGLRGRFPDRAAVVTTHADIIKALLAPALGLPLDRLYRLTIDPASTSTLVLFDEDLRVDAVNIRAGLARL